MTREIHSLRIRGTRGPIYRALLDLMHDDANAHGVPGTVQILTINGQEGLTIHTDELYLINRVRDLIYGHEKAEGCVTGFNNEADLPGPTKKGI